LPVMDGSNKAQKNVEYTYQTKSGEKTVNAATMFDNNTAIMRCLVKNLAMFGLGHYIYAGEDLPMDLKSVAEMDAIIEEIKAVTSRSEFEEIQAKYAMHFSNEKVVDACKDVAKKYPKQ